MGNKTIIGLSIVGAAVIVIIFSTVNLGLKNPSQQSSTNVSNSSSAYLDYSEEVFKAEAAKGNKIVLFFRASWCPVCYEIDKEFHDHFNDVPPGISVLKVDYVSSANDSLKKKYAITYQHTFVQIDKDGNEITKWNGGGIDNLKKYLK